MNKLAITIATLAALSTAAFAEGNQEGYVTGAMVESRTVYADEETSSEGMSSSDRFESEGQHGGRR